MNELIALDKVNPLQVFVENGLDPIIEQIRKEVKAEVLDISTEDGRKRIASLAYKVAKSKTALDEMGKKLTEDWKRQSKAVDAERRRAWDKLEDLQKDVRKPLTDWENAEKERIASHEVAIKYLETADMWEHPATIELVKKRIADLTPFYEGHEWQEFKARADVFHADGVTALQTRLTQLLKQEEEAAELSRLRAAEQERLQKEREAKIAEEAAAKAKAEAERKAKEEADALESRRKDEADAAAQREREAIERAQRAEKEKKEAEEKAKADIEAAAKAERDKIEQQKAAEAAETAKRESDKKHRAKINNEALNAIVSVCNTDTVDITPEIAKAVIEAIAKGQIPNVKITY